MKSPNLEDQVALVTGGARGVGRGIVLSLAARGANIVINDKEFDAGIGKLSKEVKDLGGSCSKYQADVSISKDVDGLFNFIREKYGRLDILINNAGISRAQDIFDTTEDDWNMMIQINLTSGFLCSKAALEMMRERRKGRIVFISSVVGQQGALYGHVHYAATKSGQVGMMKTLARTAAPFGITVNAIAPGIIQTELLDKIHGEEKINELAGKVPLGLGKPEDIGEAVVYLCSSMANYVTGVTLDVNGGMYLR